MSRSSRVWGVAVIGLFAMGASLISYAGTTVSPPPTLGVMQAPAPLAPLEGPVLASHDPVSESLSGSTDSHVFAPAPGLSQMWVYAVTSPQCSGWEYMSTRGQLSTSCDHGGSFLRVAVVEIGYGDLPLASINGNTLPRSANYQNTPICIVNNQYMWPCPAGYTVVGFVRYWNLDGNQGGQFQTSDTSTNFPYNKLSNSIYIK